MNDVSVSLYICPGNIPCNVGTHSWFVINKGSTFARWEILFRKMDHPPCWGHLYKDYFTPQQGIEIIPYTNWFFWKPHLLGKTEGIVAKKLASLIERSPTTYPLCNTFFITGPNSNTYIQWILNQVPEFTVKLPWNAFGKNYPVKDTR